MAGYAASSRLQGAVPRFVGTGPGIGSGAAPHAHDALLAGAEAPVADRIELVGRPLEEAIRDWLASIGESWSQTTFYLFDPESWR